jgi:WD40 repeat protein
MLSLRGGSRRRLLDAPSDFVSVVFSPDGQYVAAGNKDGFVWILDARFSWVVAKCPFGGSGLMIPRVIFRPDGTGIASGEKILRCWDFSPLRDVDSRRHMMKDGMEQLKQIFEFRGHKVCFFVLHMNSRFYITSHRTGTYHCCLLLF